VAGPSPAPGVHRRAGRSWHQGGAARARRGNQIGRSDRRLSALTSTPLRRFAAARPAGSASVHRLGARQSGEHPLAHRPRVFQHAPRVIQPRAQFGDLRLLPRADLAERHETRGVVVVRPWAQAPDCPWASEKVVLSARSPSSALICFSCGSLRKVLKPVTVRLSLRPRLRRNSLRVPLLGSTIAGSFETIFCRSLVDRPGCPPSVRPGPWPRGRARTRREVIPDQHSKVSQGTNAMRPAQYRLCSCPVGNGPGRGTRPGLHHSTGAPGAARPRSALPGEAGRTRRPRPWSGSLSYILLAAGAVFMLAGQVSASCEHAVVFAPGMTLWAQRAATGDEPVPFFFRSGIDPALGEGRRSLTSTDLPSIAQEQR